MKKYKFLSKMIVKKTNAFFKLSMGVFIVSLIMVSSASVFLCSQYLQWNRNFLNNENTHIITITSKIGNNDIKSLEAVDSDRIKDILKQFSSSKVYCKYTIECGVFDQNDYVYYISSITDDTGKLLGVEDFDKDNTYCMDMQLDRLKLRIPVVDINDGNFESSSMADYTIKMIRPLGEHAAINLFSSTLSNELYVPVDSFEDIIELMYGIEWSQFLKLYDNGNPFKMQVINAYYLYVENLEDVERCAKLLSENEYNVNYTIRAFENITDSISSSMLIIMGLIGIILFFSIITMILSFNSYFKMQQRDMGILKQMGYNEKALHKIYFRILAKPFLFLSLISIFYTGLLSVTILKNLFYSIINVIIILLVLAIVFGVVNKILHNYLRKNIICLLKKSKEVE